jgi:hypothetical protein
MEELRRYECGHCRLIFLLLLLALPKQSLNFL